MMMIRVGDLEWKVEPSITGSYLKDNVNSFAMNHVQQHQRCSGRMRGAAW